MPTDAEVIAAQQALINANGDIQTQIDRINQDLNTWSEIIAQLQLDLAGERSTQTNIGVAIVNLNSSLADLESQVEGADPSDPNYTQNIDLIAQQISSTNDFISRLNDQLNASNANADSLTQQIANASSTEDIMQREATNNINNLNQQRANILNQLDNNSFGTPNLYIPINPEPYYNEKAIHSDINTNSNSNNIVDNSADIDANTNAFYDAGPIIYVDDNITEDPDIVAMSTA